MYLANSRIYQCNDRATLFIAVTYSAIKMMQKVAAVGYSPVVKPAIALFSSKVSVVKDGGLIVIVVHIPIARDAGFDLFRHIPFPFAITNTSVAVVDVAAVYIAVDRKHRWHVTLSTSEYSSHTPYGRSFNFVGRTKLISFYRNHFTEVDLYNMNGGIFNFVERLLIVEAKRKRVLILDLYYIWLTSTSS